MLDTFKLTVDYLSSPTISFSILTVLTPIVFPPTDWFDRLNRKLGFHLLWTHTGLAVPCSSSPHFLQSGIWMKTLV